MVSKYLKDSYQNEVRRWFDDGGDINLRFNYDLNQNSVVLDLGGYHGTFAENIYNKFNCNVYVFEPYEPFFDIINQKFKDNEKVRVFNYGIYDKTLDVKFNVIGDGSSIVNFAEEKLNDQNFDIVKVKSFKDVYEDLNIDVIDLLKVNVEGSEYEILQHIFEEGYTRKIKNFQVQFHDTPNSEQLLLKIRKEWSNTHKQDWNYEWVWENWSLK